MTQFFNENATALVLLTAFFVCEILAHTTKIKANSLFQLIYGWIKREKDKLSEALPGRSQAQHQAEDKQSQ